MDSAITRLRSLRVLDAMSRTVLEIPADRSMSDAAVLFTENEISAAPIVDGNGDCVGILSATDFIKREARRERANTNDDVVTAHMSSAVQTVGKQEPLLSAARIMDAQHVHRLVVLDGDERPVGVISTMDIVAALINSIDEDDSH